MKNILLSLLFIPAFCKAQLAEWTKDDRNAVYEEAMSMTTKNRTLTAEQRESLSLCYLDEVTKKYTKKEYQAKIDIELKRITEATLSQCAKNIGVELTAKKVQLPEDQPTEKPIRKVNEGNFVSEDLVGTWKDQNSTLYFNKDLTYLFRANSGEKYTGTYFVNEEKNIILDNYTSEMTVTSFDGHKLKYSQTAVVKKKLFGLKKEYKTERFTAVKVE